MLGGRGSDRVMHRSRGASSASASRSSARSTTASSRRTTCPTIRTRDWRRTSTATSPRRSPPWASPATCRGSPALLQTAATTNAQMLNYSNVGRDAQVPRQTVLQWYEVLRDTLLAFELPAWSRTVKRKAIETPKFYFFDTGVVRALRRLPPVSEAAADFAEFFEHFLFWSCVPGSTTGSRARLSRIGAPDPVTRSISSSTTGSRSKRRRRGSSSASTCGVCGRSPRSDSSSDPSSSAVRSARGWRMGSRSGPWSTSWRGAVGQWPVSQPTLPPEGTR